MMFIPSSGRVAAERVGRGKGRAGPGATARARGLSLVELMVGIAVGLFIVSAATVLVSGQLGENRRLMLDTQLQQDLRATADIITRELRRANAHRTAEELIAHPTVAAKANQMLILMSPTASGSYSNVSFGYYRDNTEFGPWGFQLDTTTGAIRTQLGAVSWQDLTDRNVMEVTSLDIRIQRDPGQVLPCPRLCPTTNDTSCWPVLNVLNFVVEIAARSRADPTIVRRVQSVSRARNDWVEFRTPGALAVRPACPS